MDAVWEPLEVTQCPGNHPPISKQGFSSTAGASLHCRRNAVGRVPFQPPRLIGCKTSANSLLYLCHGAARRLEAGRRI